MSLLKFIRNIRLRQKLLLSYVIVIFLPTIVLGLYAYQSSKTSLKNQVQQSADNEARRLALEISYRLQRQDVSMKSIVFHPALLDLMSNPDQDLYAQFKTMNDKIEPIFFNLMYMVGDMTEIMLYSENRQSELGNFITPSSAVKDKDWYVATKGSETTKWWFEDGELFATRVIRNIDLQIVSAELYVQFDYNKIFGDFIGKMNEGKGIIITDQKNQPVLTEHVEQMNDVQLQSLSRSGTSKASLGGESYLVINKDIPQTDWILHYLVSDNQYNTGIRNILSATGIIVLICMVFLSIIIFLFSETLLRGIEKLNTKMKMVENGDLTVVISTNSKDEIGQLTDRFGSMLKQINQLITEVYQTKVTQKSAELKALQAQINPHFLYNSLSLINSKALRIDAQEISDLVNQLSSYYRTTLNKGKQIIAIQDEWTNVQAYIHIQLAMHNARFDVEFDADDKVFQFEMNHLILQPIVENAIMHGIDLLREGRGKLILRASLDGEDIVFVVEDKQLGAKQFIEGTSAAMFEPERSITRAEFTAMLVKALNLTSVGESKFTDVSKGAWYEEAVSIAVKAGIIKGSSITTFNPDVRIKREEMVTMMMRAYVILKDVKLNGYTASSFIDESAVASWALESVRAAEALHLINGRLANKFVPSGITSRAEAAVLLNRVIQ